MKRFVKILSLLIYCCLSISSVSAETSTVTVSDAPVIAAPSISPRTNYERIKTLRGYQGNILSIAFSPDGKLMAIGTSEQSVIIWDVPNWNVNKTLVEKDDAAWALAFSRNGKYLAAGYNHDKVHLWDTSTWEKTISISVSNSVNALSFNEDSSVLAIARDDETLLLWDIRNNKPYKKLKGHAGDVKAIDYSPDGLRLASGSSDNAVIIWDAIYGEKIKVLNGHSNNVEAISYSPDGKYLVSGSNDNSIIVWDAKTGNYIDTLAGHSERICTLSFVPGSNILASGDCIILKGPFGIPIRSSAGACEIIFWDVEAVKPINSIDGDCGLSSAAFSPDGKYFVTGHAIGGRFITIYERK